MKTMMDDWDLSMDAISEMLGRLLIRSKTIVFSIVDVTPRGTANYPGYPFSNVTYQSVNRLWWKSRQLFFNKDSLMIPSDYDGRSGSNYALICINFADISLNYDENKREIQITSISNDLFIKERSDGEPIMHPINQVIVKYWLP